MEGHLKKLHKAIETMTGHRKELASTSTSLANSIAMLGEFITSRQLDVKILVVMY